MSDAWVVEPDYAVFVQQARRKLCEAIDALLLVACMGDGAQRALAVEQLRALASELNEWTQAAARCADTIADDGPRWSHEEDA
jgi:hypothetical protein